MSVTQYCLLKAGSEMLAVRIVAEDTAAAYAQVIQIARVAGTLTDKVWTVTEFSQSKRRGVKYLE